MRSSGEAIHRASGKAEAITFVSMDVIMRHEILGKSLSCLKEEDKVHFIEELHGDICRAVSNN